MPLMLLPLYLRSDPPGATITITTAAARVSCVTPCKMKPPKPGETFNLKAELPGYRVVEYPKLSWVGNALSQALGPNPYRVTLTPVGVPPAIGVSASVGQRKESGE